MKLTKRQESLYQLLHERGQVTPAEAKDFLAERFGELSRMSVVRDFDALMRVSLAKRIGKGRGVKYLTVKTDAILREVNPKAYFAIAPDARIIKSQNLDLNIFKKPGDIFTYTELKKLIKLTDQFQKRAKKYTGTALKKEYERITIELSWKSSQMEGNTYSLIDTEILLKDGKKAKGKTTEETQMILNHKQAIEYIFDAQKSFKKITMHQIENVHQLLAKNLGIKKGLRSRPVGIIGTAYRPPDNQHEVREYIEKAVKVINEQKNALVKSLLVILLISYIQPFEDGNKRTARLLGNGILLAHAYCPLSYRNVDEAEYKKAMIIFYEQHSAKMFKELFIDQYIFAVNHYFL